MNVEFPDGEPTSEKLYAFGEGDDQWFFGTLQECANRFGLRAEATENDVLACVKMHDAIVKVYYNGQRVARYEPSDTEYIPLNVDCLFS